MCIQDFMDINEQYGSIMKKKIKILSEKSVITSQLTLIPIIGRSVLNKTV